MATAINKLSDAVAVVPIVSPVKKYEYFGDTISWTRSGPSFVISWGDNLASLTPELDGQWKMFAKIGQVTYGGLRKDLEQAFKAIDTLAYQKDKDAWLKMNASIIYKEYQDDLTHL